MHLPRWTLLLLLGASPTAAFSVISSTPRLATRLSSSAVQEEEDDTASIRNSDNQKPHVVVVGAGWAGWGAAKAACEGGARVTLLDALPDPTGQTPYLSSTGKPVEAGTRGFWKDYPNIQALCEQLDIAQPFTDFTNSSFYSPDGLEATAVVFGKAQLSDALPDSLKFLHDAAAQVALNQLPSPLGQVVATSALFERIPLADRASMIGLLVATVDCLGNANNTAVQAAYDRMTAHELFQRFGLSERLVRDFVTPTLLVGLFKPPHELSALVVMELLYYYALAHVDSFDVQWIRNGTVSDTLIAPLAQYLIENYDLDVQGGSFVQTISLDDSQTKVSQIQYKHAASQSTRTIGGDHDNDKIDGVVLALTCKGMNAVVSASPDLAQYPFFSQAASCRGIDVISVRLWLDQTVATRTPANVFSRFPELRGAGGTFFMLDQLQNENQHELWGDDTPQGSVVACDFYNAGALLTLPDDELVRLLMEDLLPSAVPAFGAATVVDRWVGKYPGVVSWFAPGTLEKRPTLQTPIANLYCAGDWVRMGDQEHGAKGLCQERALVSGYHAANGVLQQLGHDNDASPVLRPHVVLPVRADSAPFQAAVQVNQQVMSFVPRFWVR